MKRLLHFKLARTTTAQPVARLLSPVPLYDPPPNDLTYINFADTPRE